MTKISDLVLAISHGDAAEFKNQHPEYAENPIAETERSLQALTDDPRFEEWYDKYVATMIYGDEKPYFRDVVKVFREATHLGMKIDQPAGARKV